MHLNSHPVAHMIELPDGLTTEEIAAFDTAFTKEFGNHQSQIGRNVEPLSGERGGSRRITSTKPEKYGFGNQRPVNIDAIMYEFAQQLNYTDTHCIRGTWTNSYGIKYENDVTKFVTAMNTYFNHNSLLFYAKRNTIDQREEIYTCWSITVVRSETPLLRG